MICLNIDLKKRFKEYKLLEYNLFLTICHVFTTTNGSGKKKNLALKRNVCLIC